jgi:LuxR family maltose regulon positive regulatory protein
MHYRDPILLETKLHRPRLPNDLVTRARLINLLNQDRRQQLILVCAPAGFGKTTLVSNWLRHLAAEQPAPIPATWLSLDENDSDLTIFLQYFIASLRTIFSGACEETLALIQARQKPPQSIIFATLSNELQQMPGEFILVLDDYQTIHGTEVHNLLGELVRHWPRPLHLVLISRASPPISLSSLRAKGMICEIRTRDLRFTPEEATVYLNQSHLSLQSQNALPLLEERFEGWPAGLHLAALSLRSTGSEEAILAALSSENANITGYLVDEVLNHQLPAIQTFLLKTSVLNHFCAPLCEAVVGEIDPSWNARLCLEWVERSELFLISLDNQRIWYRYHHLFQELLQQRLATEMTPDQVNALHLQASTWFEAQGLIEDAMHHALAANDFELAARQMSSGLREVLNREDRPTLERWLRLLPEELVQQQPELLMIKVWAFQFLWRHDLQLKVLQKAEELLDSGWGASLPADDLQILRKQMLMPRAQQAYFSNQPERASDLCRQVLTLLPPSWTFVRGGAMFYLGISMQASGQGQAAERLLLDEYAAYGQKGDLYALFILQSLCFIYLNTCRLEQVRQTANLLIQSAASSGLLLMKLWGVWFLGMVSYHRNELESAEKHFTQIFENRYVAQISPYRDAVAGLVLLCQIKGESAAAWQLVDSISQFDLEQTGSEDIRTSSLRARLKLLQGDLEGAGNWADTFTDPPPDMALMWLEEPQVTRARILIGRGTDADLQSALGLLDTLEAITERTHNPRYQIRILVLRAMALEAQGENSQAEAALKKALALANPGGFIRVFVQQGRSMQALLQRLESQGYFSESIRRILAAYPGAENNPLSRTGSVLPEQPPSPARSALAEPLTPRELEILTLLRGPSSIKEIALKLNIAYATAKRHTINIYAKLGVSQRWDAVAQAEELSILPPR